MIGTRFGKLVVTAEAPKKRGRAHFLCQCDCGGITVVRKYNLCSGNTLACGCGKKKHRKRRRNSEHVGTKLYLAYHAMKRRCYGKNDPRYKDWGGRGITVCKEWLSGFSVFHAWAIANGYKDGFALERVNNDGPYDPSNCRWIPRFEQSRNTRKSVRITAFGETKLLSDWAKDSRCAVTLESVRQRLRKMAPELAITMPPNSRGNHSKGS